MIYVLYISLGNLAYVHDVRFSNDSSIHTPWFYNDYYIYSVIHLINPLNPHDASTHNFTFLKTDLIFLQPIVLERKFL